MSTLKVDTIRPRSGTTITFGASGDTIAAGSGVTITGFDTIISNDANNRLTTADGSGGLNAEANLNFDGSTLAVTGAITATANLAVNGVASFGDGTAAAPSVANFGDLNTGMFFPAADTIAFSEGGAEAMRITSAGNVGIGTISPTQKLDVNGTIKATSFSGDGSGLTGVSAGKILQVVNTLTSSTASYLASNDNIGTNISPINTTITPSATSSKVWITITITFEVNHDTVFELYRNSTVIGRNTASSSRWSGTFLPGYDTNTDSTPSTNTYTYLDSPSTTDAITYKLNVHSSNGSNHTLYLNRSISSAGQDSYEIATSSMTLMEVGA